MDQLRLVCIDDGVPRPTVEQLEAACVRRGVAFEALDPRRFDPAAGKLGRGDLLYRAAVSSLAGWVEQSIFSSECSSFYSDPDGPFFGYANAPLLFERAGLPIPRSLRLLSIDRDYIRTQVGSLGGLPIVVKLDGWSNGIGTVRADTFPSLFSILDLLHAQGHAPRLMAYVPDAVHWRVIVVGSRAVAAYPNPVSEDDFRTHGSLDPSQFVAEVPERLASLAVRAVASLRLEFGGADILVHESGRQFLLESNFPCYFAHAWEFGGIDVAGAMVEHLLGKVPPAVAARPLEASGRDAGILPGPLRGDQTPL